LLDAVVLSGDGTKKVSAAGKAALEDAIALGEQVARILIAQGATELIASSRAGESGPPAP
jgi:porphobilinogen deaminase